MGALHTHFRVRNMAHQCDDIVQQYAIIVLCCELYPKIVESDCYKGPGPLFAPKREDPDVRISADLRMRSKATASPIPLQWK